MLEVQTASNEYSIWHNIGEERFMANVERLSTATNKVPNNPQLYKKSGEVSQSKQESNYALPFQVERQLADDFAFLAAAEEGAKGVSAVVITENAEGPGIVVRVAANQAISLRVCSALRGICYKLEQRSRREVRFRSCKQDLLDIVVRLSRNRILARLESNKWIVPGHRHGQRSAEPLTKRLIDSFEIDSQIMPTNPGFRQHDIALRIRDLHNQFLAMENCKPHDEMESLKKIVQQASQLSGSNSLLESHVETHSVKLLRGTRKLIKSIDKIGRYWGSCSSMAIMASKEKYRHFFGSIELRPMPSYGSHNCLGVARHVHAEVQLITYFRLHPYFPPPRVMGTSKAACYLCDLFLSHHPQYTISATHGTLTKYWTIPDLAEYSSADLADLRHIVAAMNRKVTDRARRKSSLPFAPQSGIWWPPHAPSPPGAASLTSILPSSTEAMKAPTAMPIHLMQGVAVELPLSLATSPRPTDREDADGDADISAISSGVIDEISDDIIRILRPSSSCWVGIDGIDLCFELEGLDEVPLIPASFSTGKIRVRRILASEKLDMDDVLEVSAIAPGAELVLERQLSQGFIEFLLRNKGYGVTRVVCSWER